MTTGVVTDSTCDLPAASLIKQHVAAVPLKVIVGEETYRDWRDIDPPTLYGWMTQQGVLPRTSPPDPDDFRLVYTKLLEQHDELVSIHLSSRLSDTLRHAREAAEALGALDRIRFVDSGMATAALAEMVLTAAHEAAAGAATDEVVAATERLRDGLYLLLSPRSLHWLVQGGRIGRARALFGNLLELRPVLTMIDGELAPETTTRQRGALDTILACLVRRFGDAPIRLAIGFAGDDPAAIEAIKAGVRATDLNVVRGRVQLVGPAIGAQFGPGTMVICAYSAP